MKHTEKKNKRNIHMKMTSQFFRVVYVLYMLEKVNLKYNEII